jgi:hypothetical protein
VLTQRESAKDSRKSAIGPTDRVRRAQDSLYSPWLALQLLSIAAAAVFGLLLSGIAPPTTDEDWFVSGAFIAGCVIISAICARLCAPLAVKVAIAALVGLCATLWVALGEGAALAPIAVAGLLLVQLGDRFYSHNDFVQGARPLLLYVGDLTRRTIRTILNVLFGGASEKLFGPLVKYPPLASEEGRDHRHGVSAVP